MKLFDLHTHTFHSDGELIPSESARYASIAGYSGIAVTDHADASNLSYLLDVTLAFKEVFNKSSDGFLVIAGVELTHVNPKDIGNMTEIARKGGADIVIVHGETIAEPVYKGTNAASIEAKVDILAHPGLITLHEAKIAARNGVALEITSNRSHAFTNAHVAIMARESGAETVINNDAHSPYAYVGKDQSTKIMLGAGLTEAEIEKTFNNNEKMFNRLLNKSCDLK